MFTLDSVIPRFPLTCITRNDKDLAICCPIGIYIIEDYGLTSIKRRFFTLEQEFRAILYTSSNSVNLICLSADGQSIWTFDCIDGILKLLLESSCSTEKFTSIQIKNETELLIGTFTGEIILKSLINSDQNILKYSEYPILLISSDSSHFIDSQGKLFSNEKLIFDDGILQPSRILISLNHLYLVKHNSVYIFDSTSDEFITKITSNDLISAAEIDQNDKLVICTDRGRLFILDGLKLKDLNEDNKNSLEADELESESEGEELEEFDIENSDKFERIFGLIRHPSANEILILKVDDTNKRAWIEEVTIHGDNKVQSTPITINDTAVVICPLCDVSDNQQTLPINGNTCLKGHPITICSQSKQLIIKKCYKCRNCNCSFTTNPKTCPFCHGLITK